MSLTDRKHRLRPTTGGDPDEPHRSAAPPEGTRATSRSGTACSSSSRSARTRRAGAGLVFVVMPAPVVMVVGYETVGHRYMAEVMERVLG